MTRVPPSTKTREAIQRLLSDGTVGEDPKSALLRLGMQAMAEEVLEAAGCELLGRDYYQRGDGSGTGYHNGYPREAVLCSWCITWTGRKVLIQVAPGSKESTEC